MTSRPPSFVVTHFVVEDHHHDEGRHHHDVRHVDKALVAVAFDRTYGYQPRPENHPMRYWAIAGWGPVPAALRAPKGIYRQLELINSADRDQTIQHSIGAFWFEKYHHQNIIFFGGYGSDIKVGDVKWVAVIDVRDDTTVENLRIPPKGSEAIVWSLEELQTFRPPIDTETGREYIEMTSGEVLVTESCCLTGRSSKLLTVGNAAVGKWFWKFYPSRDGVYSSSQLVVWHESVDDTDEYRSPCPENDVVRLYYYQSGGPCHQSQLGPLVKDRKEALAAAEAFLWTADAEPQLKHVMAQFMSKDPNGLWLKSCELADGFLVSGFNMHMAERRYERMLVGEFRSEKLCFVNMVDWVLFDSIPRTIMGGCAVKLPGETELLSMQFKPSRATGKIVAMRVFV